VTGPGGTLYVLCFSDDGPGTGPHPVSQAELRAAFAPEPDGMSPPSCRTGSGPTSTMTAARRPGSRRSHGS